VTHRQKTTQCSS